MVNVGNGWNSKFVHRNWVYTILCRLTILLDKACQKGQSQHCKIFISVGFFLGDVSFNRRRKWIGKTTDNNIFGKDSGENKNIYFCKYQFIFYGRVHEQG